ncbi:3' terminal RNA ribose 2'-O-methyltransferase Hen1 [Haloferula sp. BvORR071]|uniref:3' terminal RNA ribose 2'-O-methyltransferase Hen1 n=1 Tax=Haloferula sp. BvORR071 TaxID=1396141 RepID=UPI0009468884|nr:3' terminal RNA ribose 2'-O-methyltransferase Hen1 [Haloferula sp. BvORR071]
MLLTITNRTPDATDLGHLLHKHPARSHAIDLAFGKGLIFYPVARQDECKAVLSVEVDPIDMVRSPGARQGGWALGQYVNDRPYAASSFLSVAISRGLGTALNGRCTKRPELVDKLLDLEVCLPVVPAGDGEMLKKLFEPLGYAVETERLPLDPAFPAWGESRYHKLTLRAMTPLHLLLKHLFVMLGALDRAKHYWVGQDEIDKLLAKGEGWLATHPEKDWIVRRYLKFQKRLAREALERLAPEPEAEEESEETEDIATEPAVEKKISLHELRLDRVTELIASYQPGSVLDLGCGDGKLIRRLLGQTKIPKVTGMDVSSRALEVAHERLERLPPFKRQGRVEIFLGSLVYRDSRLRGYDVAALVEVIEHLDADRLDSLEEVVFAAATPQRVIVTTPNREYNVLFEGMKPGALRHADHRFEWTRSEFRIWAERVAGKHGYEVAFEPLGEEDAEHGPPSQMAVFTRRDGGNSTVPSPKEEEQPAQANTRPSRSRRSEEFFSPEARTLVRELPPVEASEVCHLHLGGKARGYFSLPDGHWILRAESTLIGHWAEAYDTDSAADVAAALTALPWQENDTVYFFTGRSLVTESTWAAFVRHWMDFLAIEDDEPVVTNLQRPWEALIFNSGGGIRYLTGEPPSDP